MTLIWELNFIRNTDGQQKIMVSRSYENGRYNEKLSSLTDEKVIFINYVSLFPAKDIVRIKLGHYGEFVEINQYSFYYLDKTFFNYGFLGAFGVSEYNENVPFDWPEIEFVAKFLFAEYIKRLKDGRLITPEGSQEYLDWVQAQMLDYYQDFINAKQDYLDSQTQAKKNSLLNAFQSAAACAENKDKSKNNGKKPTKSMTKLREITDQIIEVPVQSEKQNLDIDWTKLKREFEFTLINSYGNPLTKIMSFINGDQKEWGSEEEQNVQSLEGMTYSVLKSFVDQQKLNLRYMEIRKPNNEGFEFTMFSAFKVENQSYLIIMNIENFDPECQKSIGILKGDEERVLEKITRELKEHKEWFTDKGEFKDRKIAFEVESVFYRNCKKNFQ